MFIWPSKPAGATASYAFDFSKFLAAGETITGTPGIAEDGVTLAAGPTVNSGGNEVTVELAGGTPGTVASVTCTITTSLGTVWPEIGVLQINGEAVSLDLAKASQRIEDDSEDAVLASYLRAAIALIERQTSKNLTAKIEPMTVDGFPPIYCDGAPGFGALGYGAVPGYEAWRDRDQALRLFKGPVSSILSIEYDDPNGVTQTLGSFRLIEGANAKLLPAYGQSWPSTARGPGTVRISYVAGYDPTELPPELTQAAILLFGHWNANREAAITGLRAAAVELPLGVAELIAPYSPPGIA